MGEIVRNQSYVVETGFRRLSQKRGHIAMRRKTGKTSLAFLLHFLEELNERRIGNFIRFFERVSQQHIHMVGLESPKTRLNRLSVLLFRSIEAKFRLYEHLVSLSPKHLAHHFFVPASHIGMCSVEKIDAKIKGAT